jgi:hypothetical protein
MNYDIQYYKYDIGQFNFDSLVTNLFKVDKLYNIHTLLDNISDKLFSNVNDDSTKLHSIFYDKLNTGWPEFMNTYKSFIKNVIMDIYDTNVLIYQAKPTFRIQLPNNIAVGGNATDAAERYGWHRDSDPEYNHPLSEKNFIVPLTTSRETASVYIETFPGSDKFKPAVMNVGEVFKFSGAECIHGNKPNQTGESRVSFDFRVMLKDDYDENYSKGSKLSNQKFVVGEYYEIMER